MFLDSSLMCFYSVRLRDIDILNNAHLIEYI